MQSDNLIQEMDDSRKKTQGGVTPDAGIRETPTFCSRSASPMDATMLENCPAAQSHVCYPIIFPQVTRRLKHCHPCAVACNPNEKSNSRIAFASTLLRAHQPLSALERDQLEEPL